MHETHYLHEGDLLAEGSGADLSLGDRSGELFLVFSIHLLGLCALPIAAVQAVCAADGPVRRVPLCGGASSRFAGLVSVRGQVQMLFDLSAPPSLLATAAAQPALADHLLVAVAGDGRTLALRVSPPLRLVRRALVENVDAKRVSPRAATVGEDSALLKAAQLAKGTGAGNALTLVEDSDSGSSVTGASLIGDSAAAAAHDAAGAASAHSTAGTAYAKGRAGDVAAPVCGSFTMAETDGGAVWLLSAERLFAQLEAEVRHG